MNLRKTCINCRYYSDTLMDSNPNSFFHTHNYCWLWKKEIPVFTIFNKRELTSGYDDIECGLAYCWGFDQKRGELETKFKTNEDDLK